MFSERAAATVVRLLLVSAMLSGADVAVALGTAEPPRIYLDTAVPVAAGRTLEVLDGGDFQAALDAAQPGDVISLAAGATFTGNFVLRNTSGEGWIIIRTSAPDSLPPPGNRITPAHTRALPRVVTPNSAPAITTDEGAHHYHLLGLEITVDADVSDNSGLVQLGTGHQASLAQVPHDIVLDRVYIHGNPSVVLRRNVTLNSAATAVIDSYLSEAHDPANDAQAILGWNGPGPFAILNNYLEASGENIMFGGGDPAIEGLVPSDIEIRQNHVSKPLAWRPQDPSYQGTHWLVKNLLELKNAQRVLIDGNVFEQNWADGQTGMAILFTGRNQDGGAPWSVVQDITFSNNAVMHSAGGISILGMDDLHPNQQTSRIWIRNSLFLDIDSAWGGDRLFQVLNGAADVVIEHVTALQTGLILVADLAPNTGFVFRDNIAVDGGYGVVATSSSQENLATYFPGAAIVNNAILGGQPYNYPPGNFMASSAADVGFANLATGDYRLADASPFRGVATDGTDLGVDIVTLTAAAAGALAGTRTPRTDGPSPAPRYAGSDGDLSTSLP